MLAPNGVEFITVDTASNGLSARVLEAPQRPVLTYQFVVGLGRTNGFWFFIMVSPLGEEFLMSLLIRLPQKLFWATLSIFGFKKPEPPSRLINPPPDPRFEHPAYKNIPDEIRRVISDPSILRNPPYQEGYYGLIAGEFCMYEFQSRLLSKIKGQAGLTPEDYKAYLKPMLVNYAELVHLLPASENHHHNTPGGLLRHGLESAAFMLDWMVLSKFDHELTPGQASMRLRRWYVAGIVAALYHDAGKPLSDVEVMSFDGSIKWYMGTDTIHEWSVKNNLPRYFINWVRNRHNNHTVQSTALVANYTSPELRLWLIQGGQDIWAALLNAVAGQPGPLTDAVRVADSRSVKADRERGAATGGNTSTGVPVQRLCIDAMRQLVDNGTWTFNQAGSRLWQSSQGLFLAWSTGSNDIIHEIEKYKVGGFPRSENTLLAAMADYEILEKTPNGSLIWFVSPHPLFKNGKTPSIRCIKLKNPSGIFPFLDGLISPVSVTIGRDDNAKDFLTKEDAIARKEQEKNGAQKDLFSRPGLPASEQLGKDKGKSRTQKLAEERTGVSLPADLEARVQRLQTVEQEVPPPPEPKQKPDDHSDEIDDDALAAMLHEINGTTPESAPKPAQAGEPAAEKAPDEKLKLTASDLLCKKPKPVDKGRSDKPKDRSAAQKSAPDSFAVPTKLKSLLTEQDRKLLQANPDLGSRLLRMFEGARPVREVRNRAFIPLDGDIGLDDLASIDRAGWLSRDFTNPEGQATCKHLGKQGLLASTQLSLVLCRLTGADWHPKCLQALPAEQQGQIAYLARTFRAAAVPEPSHGPRVWSLPFWVRDRLVRDGQLDPQTAEDAICYGLEGIRVGRVRKYFFEGD